MIGLAGEMLKTGVEVLGQFLAASRRSRGRGGARREAPEMAVPGLVNGLGSCAFRKAAAPMPSAVGHQTFSRRDGRSSQSRV